MQPPWPVPVVALTPASCGAVLWRMQRAERLTILVKATLRLVHEANAEITAPLEIVRSDVPADGHGSLEEACETAPYLPNAGVLARGHAYAPAGQPATALVVRLALHRDGLWALDKVVHVFGDRTRESPGPRPFQRIPIVYERAYGGPHVAANPAGMSAGAALPNVLDPADPARPVGLGPVARRWAPRRYFLGGEEEPSAVAPELDARFDFRYFNAAPPDQQIGFLRADEWIFLQGMHPQLPWIRSRLPSARGVARLRRAGAGGQGQEQPVDLVADTLTIDADRLICSVIWRGNVALQPGDTPERLRVLAGVELPGLPVRWPSIDAPRAPAEEAVVGAPRRPRATLDLRDAAVVGHRERPVAPFALAPPASGDAPALSPIPGAPWSARRPASTLPPPDAEGAGPSSPGAAAPGGWGSRAAPASPTPLDELTVDSSQCSAPPSSSALPFVPATSASAPPAPSSARVPFALPFIPSAGVPAAAGADQSVEGPAPPAFVPAPWAGTPTSQVDPAPVAAAEALAARTLASAIAVAAPLELEAAAPETKKNAAQAPEARGPEVRAPAPSEPEARGPEVRAPAPSEPEAKGIRATLLARLKDGEPFHDLSLSGVELDDIDFSGASLERLSFAGSSLVRCKFERARLAGANLSGADLTEASFAGADLSAADLAGARLEAARLDGATLAHADLAGAKGSNARFEGASLEGADLRQARLPGAVFDRANLSSSPASSADLSGSSFVRANLTGANVRAAKLRGATLTGAIVKGADLRDADLTGANLHGVDLASARTGGAILRDVIERAPEEGAAVMPREGEPPPPAESAAIVLGAGSSERPPRGG